MRASGYRLGLLLVTGSALAWSTAGLFTRLIALDTATMLAWRGLFGAIGLAAVALLVDGGNRRRAAWAMNRPGWLFVLLSALGMICFIASLRHTTVAHVAVIYATVPLMAGALAWVMLRERPSRSAMTASLAVLVGITVMVGLGREGGLVGDSLALGMTLSMAGIMVLARKYPDIPIMPAACFSALLSGFVCWPFGAPMAVSAHDLLLLSLFGLVNSAAGLALFTLGARLLPAIETALIGSLDAPLAPLWVWLAFGETPGRSTLAGGLIVFAAVAVHILAETRKRQSVQPPGAASSALDVQGPPMAY